MFSCLINSIYCRLQSLNEVLSSGDQDKSKEAFLKEVNDLNAQIEEEKKRQLEALQRQSVTDNSQGTKKSWSEPEVQMLIKGVNLFPAGTKDRYMN